MATDGTMQRRQRYGQIRLAEPSPGECVNATSVNMFKNKIGNYFKRSGYV